MGSSLNRAVLLLVLIVGLVGLAFAGDAPTAARAAPVELAPQAAVGIRLDTALIGGYASGGFAEAVRTISSDLSSSEQTLVGEHLERIFREKVGSDGLGGNGRLRVVYERALRADGTTRSIRVLGAEVASAGRLHTAFYFEREGKPGYYDPFGTAVDAGSWGGPLSALRVSSAFGNRRMHPIVGRVLPHTGVDFAAPAGEPVRATADGLVTAAGERGGYGLLVELSHPNGYGTRYAHLQRIAEGVRTARLVRQGEIVGYVGMTGLATGPHLHYEVRRRGQPVDPLLLSAAEGPSARLGSEERWSEERRRVTNLLAQAPTMVRAARASD